MLQRGVSKQLAVENTHNPTDTMEFFHTGNSTASVDYPISLPNLPLQREEREQREIDAIQEGKVSCWW